MGSLGRSVGRAFGRGFARARNAGTNPQIILSATSIAEDASITDVIGILSVANGSGTYTFSITADPDSKFQIDNDDELQLADTVDYETATSHQVTIEADNGVDDPIERTFTIGVTDVDELPGSVTLTWEGDGTDATPGFTVDLPVGQGAPLDAAEDDVLRIESSSGVLYLTYTLQAADITAEEVTGVASADPLADGSYSGFRARLERDGVNFGPWSAVTNGPVIVDTDAPALSTLAISSSAGGDNFYVASDVIEFTATFDEAVIVTGTPRVPFTVGASTKNANYATGSGTTELKFRYTVQTGDADSDGISVGANALELNSGTIKDVGGNNAAITHSAITTDASHKVDAVAPQFSTGTSANVDDDVQLSHTITTDETTTKAITGGVDAAHFEIVSGGSTNVSHTLRWLSDGTRDFDSPTDTGANNTYVVQVTATDAAGNTANQTITITVVAAGGDRWLAPNGTDLWLAPNGTDHWLAPA